MADSGLIIVPKPGQLLAALTGDQSFEEPAVPPGYLSGLGRMSDHDFKSQMLGSWSSDDEAKEAKGPQDAEAAALNESIFAKLAADTPAAKAAADTVNDFIRQQMRQDGFFRKILPPLEIGNDALDQAVAADKAVVGIDWGSADEEMGGSTVFTPVIPGGITLKDMQDAFALLGQAAVQGDEHVFSAHDDPFGEPGVDIAFWYYKKTTLIYSVRRVADNFFYDFATKTFKILPASPRAGLPKADEVRPAGFLYSTRLSGQLADGEYVITVRDTKADDVVVGITAVFMRDGVQQQSPTQGLEDTPIEEGIPTPEGTYKRAERRVRSIDV